MFYYTPKYKALMAKPMISKLKWMFLCGSGIALSVVCSTTIQADGNQYGFGKPASDKEIAKINIDVMPDGRGAPPGQGEYTAGKKIYRVNCAACHGVDMKQPIKGTGAPALLGGRGSLASSKPNKTVESYWPYASTLFDYVKRAMPFNRPGSLTDNQVYSLVAYILAEGKIINQHKVMNAKTLANVKMPNRNGFISDPRPEVFNINRD